MKHRYWILFCVILISLGTFGCGDDITRKYYSGEDCCDIVGDLDEPTGDNGNFVISLKGGEAGGDNHFGGFGGELYVSTYASAGMYVKTRNLDTDFTVPIPEYPEELGDNPLTLEADAEPYEPVLLIDPNPATDEPAEGTLYMTNLGPYLNVSDGDGDIDGDTIVTGLKVEAGATLILPLNGGDSAGLEFDDDVVIEGTVETANLTESLDKGSLYLGVYGHFTTAAGSLIDTSGDDAVSVGIGGGDAGYVEIYVWDYNGALLQGTIDASGGDGLGIGAGGNGNVVNVDPSTEYGGTLINTGTINVSGGDGADGGWGGVIVLASEWAVYNTGALSANGGLSTTGYGGSGGGGGVIVFEPDAGSLYNSGNLFCHGGNGDAGGGTGGVIDAVAGDEYAGDFINSGNLNASGGSATYYGGSGGEIYLAGYGGSLISTGEIAGNGGNAPEGYGGWGGDLIFFVEPSSDMYYGEAVAPGLIQITGNISLNGGDGGINGAGGGHMGVYNDEYDCDMFPPVNPTELLGYSLIDASGGDGGYGGYGGGVHVYTEDAWFGSCYDAFPTGPIANRVDIMAVGGDATGTDWHFGGYGGYVNFEAEGEAYSGFTVCLNSGDINVSGGSGEMGWPAGWVFFYGHDYVENTGEITATGGESTADFGLSGYGGWIEISSSAAALNSGDVIATGGLASGDPSIAGDGGEFFLFGVDEVTNSGSIYCDGADSLTYWGGCGGLVAIGSQKMSSTNSAEFITVAAGSGPEEDGEIGDIWIDGFNVTPVDGTLP